MPPRIPNIPIKRTDDISTCRYKMPRLTQRNVSSGNGVKTAILNAENICKSINRTPQSLNQWFAFSLGSSCKYNVQQGQILINGSQTNDVLQNLLYDFIDHFILCPVCTNPETTFESDQNGNLVFVCRACGNSTPLEAQNTTALQKMAGWFKSRSDTETKTGQEITPSRPSPVIQEQKVKRSGSSSAGKSSSKDSEFIDVDSLMKKLAILEPNSEEVPKKELEPAEFEAFFNEFVKHVQSDEPDSDVYNFYCKTAETTPWDKKMYASMGFSSVFKPVLGDPSHDLCKDILRLIEKRRGLLIRFSPDEATQKVILIEMVKLIEKAHPEYLSSAPIIFYTLYENEIVEEKVITAWYKGAMIKSVETKEKYTLIRKLLEPFMEWMKNAEFEPETKPEEEIVEEKAEEPVEEKKEEINIDDI